ncbi:uncharacterized protein C9orf50 homolog isoform X1 [Prionailurus iriomotensis]
MKLILSTAIKKECVRALPAPSPVSPLFLPFRPASLYFQNSLKKILLRRIPALGTLKRDRSQFITFKKANHWLNVAFLENRSTDGSGRPFCSLALEAEMNSSKCVLDASRPHGVQAPKLKTVLAHSSSGEGSKKRRRFCPFRVRFADETLRDSALRYWERALAEISVLSLDFDGGVTGLPTTGKKALVGAAAGVVRQGHIEKGIATGSMTSERVFRSVGRWLESLPKALCPRAQEEATASISFSWDCPGLAPQEPQGHLSEDASMKSSLPFIPRATTQRPQSGLKTFLEAHSSLEQVDRSPSSWSQKLESFLPSVALVLNRGRPKGSCLL